MQIMWNTVRLFQSFVNYNVKSLSYIFAHQPVKKCNKKCRKPTKVNALALWEKKKVGHKNVDLDLAYYAKWKEYQQREKCVSRIAALSSYTTDWLQLYISVTDYHQLCTTVWHTIKLIVVFNMSRNGIKFLWNKVEQSSGI